MKIQFQAMEYHIDGGFQPADYEFDGDLETGWQINRNRKKHLTLGKGYKPVRNRLCGICATDLARRFMPFPLPQVIGHEVVAMDMETMEKSVVEINDTSYYRGEFPLDPFSQENLYTHTPGRMVLGIDRLPGGFGPYALAPKKSIIPIGHLNEYAGVLIEPFAAAFHAVLVSPPQAGDSVAVLGPRRLGTLLVAALHAFRQSNGIDFEITAAARHQDLLELCHRFGSDREIHLQTADKKRIISRFDIVYDTTGSESGFQLALQMARKEVHLKSTSGRPVLGFKNLTPLVVDELSLLPFDEKTIHFKWENEDRDNQEIYVAGNVHPDLLPGRNVHRLDGSDAVKMIRGPAFQNRLPRFDLAVASSVQEIDSIIRPVEAGGISLVRPRGAILFAGDAEDNPLLNFIQNGGRLRSSRCGDFVPAMKILKENPELVDAMAHFLISHVFPSDELPKAFQHAAESRSRKVVIKHL
ncbi:MAG: threonine dehydrogenase [Desulfobacteraceae bacterium]|nr:MAG: threonine dehydrogenase [Desulfobacteraceae bacterium]